MEILPSDTPDGIPMADTNPEAVAVLPTTTTNTAAASDPSQPLLFNDAELQAALPANGASPNAPHEASGRPTPRINKPERTQGEWRAESLDQRLDADHPARLVWQYVEILDLSKLFNRVKAVEGGAGRNASDFRVLFALLLWANIDGVARAREIE